MEKYKCPEPPITEDEKQSVINDKPNIDLWAKSRILPVVQHPYEVVLANGKTETRHESRYVSEFKDEPMFLWVSAGMHNKAQRALSYDAARLYGLDPRKAAYYAILSWPMPR